MGYITGTFFYFFGAIIWIFYKVFSYISYKIPTDVTDNVTYYFLQLNYFRGFVNIGVLLQVISMVLFVWSLLYAIKIFTQTIFPMLPWIGKYIHLPEHGNVASQVIHEKLRFGKIMKSKDKISTKTR